METEIQTTSGKNGQHDAGAAAPAAAARTLPRFLDQRLDQGLELVRIESALRRGGRGGEVTLIAQPTQ